MASDAGDADGLVGGAPWVGAPFVKQGNRRRLGKQDAQSRVILRAVDQVIALATDGSLTFCALENSPNIGTVLRGEKTSFLSDMLDRLNAALPGWSFDVHISSLSDWWPMSRKRLWLRGVDKLLLGDSEELPEPALMRDLKVSLEELLEKDVPNMEPECLKTVKRMNTLCDRTDRIKADYNSALLGRGEPPGKIAIFDLNNPRSVLLYDTVPSLSFSPRPSQDLFIASVKDVVEGTPIKRRAFHRLLTVRERFLLQGHPADDASKFNKALGKFATGNAFAVPMVASVVGPLVTLAMKHKRRLVEEGSLTSQHAKRIKF